MKIGFLVEGPTERKVIPILVRKIIANQKRKPQFIPPRVVPQGDLMNARKIQAYIEKDLYHDHPDLSKVIICRDSECTDPKLIKRDFQSVQQELKRLGVKIPVAYCVVVHALEGWLMADTQAISQFVGRANLKIPKPESICKPKDELKRIFGRINHSYNPSRDNSRIAELVDVNRIADNNKSFAHFCRLVRG